MVVRDWMTTEIVWIRPSATVQEALKMMKHYGIRHLPVKNDEGALVGWITDSDVRSVLIASMIERLTVADVMIREPYVASPQDHLDDVAFTMVVKKIGGLPVLEGDRLVGIITVIDVLRAFMEMIGRPEDTGRIDIISPHENHTNLTDLVGLIQMMGGTVLSVCTFFPEKEDNTSPTRVGYSIHVKGKHFSEIVQLLQSRGVSVAFSHAPHPLKTLNKYAHSPSMTQPNAE